MLPRLFWGVPRLLSDKATSLHPYLECGAATSQGQLVLPTLCPKHPSHLVQAMRVCRHTIDRGESVANQYTGLGCREPGMTSRTRTTSKPLPPTASDIPLMSNSNGSDTRIVGSRMILAWA